MVWVYWPLSDFVGSTHVLHTGDKVLKATGVASDGEPWVSKVLTSISQLEADEKHVSLLVEHDEELLPEQHAC